MVLVPRDKNIVVVDYHKGNLSSVLRSVAEAGGNASIEDDPKRIAAADGIVVPGVGALEDAMDYLNGSGQAEALKKAVSQGVLFLGICLGLHVLFERGNERSQDHEGSEWVAALGLEKGSITKLESTRMKVPHVGWDQIHLTEAGKNSKLFSGVADGSNVYFTHSYATSDDINPATVLAQTHYTRSFASAIAEDNIFGVQFHPEKSSATGLKILSNFVHMVERGRS
ncbi:MAG: imidazole glycerol phosphate synthase subunit HisH [Atopobiaceae bacterium]|jgi:glutamine amidotransferase